MLTLAGFLLLVLQFFMFTFYDRDFYASDELHTEVATIPNWVWLVAALCLFWAHTLGSARCSGVLEKYRNQGECWL